MKLNYIIEPRPEYVTRIKAAGMKHARTEYTCPLCKVTVSKRDFEHHATTVHSTRANEVFARLFGVEFPARCTCGKELHYSSANKGFPKTCGACNMGTVSNVAYNNAEDAHKHVEQLKAMLANAMEEEKRLKEEAELSKIPLADLPLPTGKDVRFLKRLSVAIRVHTVNSEKDKLLELANVIDSKLGAR